MRLMRRCTACVHPDRAAIDAALLKGVSYPTVAGRHGLSTSAVFRHRRRHVDAPTVGDIVEPAGKGHFWQEWDGTKWQRIDAPLVKHLLEVTNRSGDVPWRMGYHVVDGLGHFPFTRKVYRRQQTK